MSTHLLDTNHASELLLGNELLWDRMIADSFGGAALCRPSIGELWYMVYNSGRVAENRSGLARMLRQFNVVEFDASAAHEYGRVRAELRQAGTSIPQIDIQIGAIARVQGLVLLTSDAHFSYVADLQVESWLKP